MDYFKGYKGRRTRLSSNQRLAVFVGSIMLLSAIGLVLGYVVASGLGEKHGLDISGASPASTATAINQATPATIRPGQVAVASQSPVITTRPTVTATISLAASPLPQGGAEVAPSPSPDPAFIFTFEGSPAPTPGAASAPVAPQNPVPATISTTVSVVATDTIALTPTQTQTVAADPPVTETSPVPSATPTPAPEIPATSTPVVRPTNSPTAVPTATSAPPPTPTVAAASAPLPTSTATSVPATATSTPVAATATFTAAPIATSMPTIVPATATPTTALPTTTVTSVPASATPTSTFTPGSNPVIKLEYRTSNSQDSITEIRPDFNLVNSGPDSVLLGDLTIRYWFTEDGDGNPPQDYTCDFAVVSCDNLTAHFVKLATGLKGADSYLEIGFNNVAGSLQPGGSTGEIKSRFNKQDWSNYIQSNDYSFDPSKSAFASWKHVTLYYKGTLIWGVEPEKKASK